MAEEVTDPIGYFISRIAPRGECWEWRGIRSGKGYGVLPTRAGTSRTLAHRFSYELHTRQMIPAGWLICHRCDHPWCVNPKHLFVGTPKDNAKDALLKGRSTATAVMVTARGETRHLSEWARLAGISKELLRYRIRSGWDPDEALSLPPRAYHRRVP